MKLLTLNTHSLSEENYSDKVTIFVDTISNILPQVIALQEVNQTCCKAVVPREELAGYYPCNELIEIRDNNHVYKVVKKLREKGIEYHWTWIPIKKGYRIFDEGIALMSLSPILDAKIITVSNIDDYNNWKTRKIVGIRIAEFPDQWFFSVHFGWWEDEEEPFCNQWKKAEEFFDKCDTVWVMGDFNNPAEIRGEGYDLLKSLSWHDTYHMAAEKDSGITVGKVIDGWRDKICDSSDMQDKLCDSIGMRIDQIWCNTPEKIKSSKVIFNGINSPVISDHYGVIIEK